jgi:sec-independent protein translocase protein TatB
MIRRDCRLSSSGSMMKLMSFSETIFLFVLALVIFGPKKLPEIARQIGKYMNEFKRASNEFKAQIEQEIAHLDVTENKQTILPPSAAVEGTASRTLYPAPVEAIAAPATLAAPLNGEEQPVSVSTQESPAAVESAPVATEALPATDDVGSEVTSSPTTQESHA